MSEQGGVAQNVCPQDVPAQTCWFLFSAGCITTIRGAKSMNSEQGLGDESCWSISVLVFPFWSLLERSQLYDGLQASSCVGSNLGTKNAYFYVSSCYQVCVVLAGHRSSSFTCLTPTAFPAACRNQRSSSKAEIRLVAIKNIKGGNFKEIYLWCG